MRMDNSEALPGAIADEERLARAVFYPYHIAKSGKIKKEAFKAPTGGRDVSVNRLRAIGADECKMRAKSIHSPGTFEGFAVVTAGDVRQCGSDVVDSREIYFGHADIMHDVVLKSGVPAPPDFNQRLKKIANRANFFADPSPDSDIWSGEDLVSNG